MKRRPIFVTSTLLIAAVVAVWMFYSKRVVKAALPDFPAIVGYLPAESRAVFGMNVQKLINSPAYARLEEKHPRMGAGLGEFIAETGVDPRTDISFVVGNAQGMGKREGVLLAEGRFNTAAIETYVFRKANPIKTQYKGATVLMLPERRSGDLKKGVALLAESEIAVGGLDSLKAVIDVRNGSLPGVAENATLGPILRGMNANDMFWFAGDAQELAFRGLGPAPLRRNFNLEELESVFGTVNVGDSVEGNVAAVARDPEAARKLADGLRGLMAFGQLAAGRNPDLAQLLKGVSVSHEQSNARIDVAIRLPLSGVISLISNSEN
jgi:hypothetical protein